MRKLGGEKNNEKRREVRWRKEYDRNTISGNKDLSPEKERKKVSERRPFLSGANSLVSGRGIWVRATITGPRSWQGYEIGERRTGIVSERRKWAGGRRGGRTSRKRGRGIKIRGEKDTRSSRETEKKREEERHGESDCHRERKT